MFKAILEIIRAIAEWIIGSLSSKAQKKQAQQIEAEIKGNVDKAGNTKKPGTEDDAFNNDDFNEED